MVEFVLLAVVEEARIVIAPESVSVYVPFGAVAKMLKLYVPEAPDDGVPLILKLEGSKR